MSQPDNDFPLEFVVGQTPVSGQTKNYRARERWEEIVGQHAQDTINRSRDLYFLDERPLMATIYYFPPTRMDGDVDNIVKPVLDGMVAVV